MIRVLAIALAALCLALPARACGVELVLAMDVSRSVVNSEYDLQMGGLAAAFRDPEVVETITWTHGGVMATVTQWSGPRSQAQTVPWTHLTDADSAARFAAAISGQRRQFFAAFTAIGEALIHAAALSALNPNPCLRKVIDVSGDGRSNRGRAPGPVADLLASQGVTINGLVIQGGRPDPTEHYRTEVIRGGASFLEAADGFEDYARAIKAKLLRELSPQLSAR